MSCNNYFSAVRDNLLEGPLCVQLEISGKCIAKCVTCSNKEYTGLKHPTLEENKEIIKKLKDSGVKAIRLTGGEPILADQFDKVVAYCKKQKIKASITTTLLTKNEDYMTALLDVSPIKVSLSTVGDEYHKFFGIPDKNFNVVKKNLDFLKENKKRFSVNYTIFEDNYSIESLTNFIEFMNDYKPSYVTFFPALMFDHPEAKEIVRNLKEVSSLCNFRSNILTVGKHFARRKPKENLVCHINKFHAHIKNNGDVYPCCMTGGEVGQNLNKKLLLGNLHNQSMKNIYKKKFDIFEGVNMTKFDECKECTQRYTMLNQEFDSFINDEKFREL